MLQIRSSSPPTLFQESGSIYLQFTCSTALQLEVIFEVLEEYDWTAFSVVTTRHHGYEDFLAMVEGTTDGSFIGWEIKSVVVLNVTDDPGGTRTKRLLKDNEAQVRLTVRKDKLTKKVEELLFSSERFFVDEKRLCRPHAVLS